MKTALALLTAVNMSLVALLFIKQMETTRTVKAGYAISLVNPAIGTIVVFYGKVKSIHETAFPNL